MTIRLGFALLFLLVGSGFAEDGKDQNENLLAELKEIVNLERSRSKRAAKGLCLRLAFGDTKFEKGAEIEAVYTKLRDLGLDEQANEFYVEFAQGFSDRWKLQFTRGSHLAEQDRLEESGEVFRSLLEAEGELNDRIDLNFWDNEIVYASIQNDFRVDVPEELQARGWTDRVLQLWGQFWQPGFRETFQSMENRSRIDPESVLEARAMSFCSLARQGKRVPGFSSVDYPELLAALCRGGGEFEEIAVGMMSDEPEDFRLKVLFLTWVDQGWGLGESGKKIIPKTLKSLAKAHPDIALQEGWRFVRVGVWNEDEWTAMTLGIVEEHAGDRTMNAVAAAFFPSRPPFREDPLSGQTFMVDSPPVPVLPIHARRPEIRKHLLEWAVVKKGNVAWIRQLTNFLAGENKVEELIELLNGCVSEEVAGSPPANAPSEFSTQFVDRSSNAYQARKDGSGTSLFNALPPSFFYRLGSPAMHLIQYVGFQRSGNLDESRKKIQALRKLSTFYPGVSDSYQWMSELSGKLEMIRDPELRGLLSAMIGVEDEDVLVQELLAIGTGTSHMLASWIEEQRGDLVRCREILLGIEVDELSDAQKVGWFQRTMVLGERRIPELKEEAREAWNQLTEESQPDLPKIYEEIAPLLGITKPSPAHREVKNSDNVQRDPISVVRDLIEAGRLEDAVETTFESLFKLQSFGWGRMVEVWERNNNLEKITGMLASKASSPWDQMAVAEFAGELGRRELAKKLYRKVLEKDGQNFEAHLGLITFEKPGDHDFERMIKSLSFEQIEEGVGDWRGKVERRYRGNVGEEIALLGLFSEVVRISGPDDDLSFVAKFLIRKEKQMYARAVSGIGISQVGQFDGWEKALNRREKQLAELLLAKRKVAKSGFAKLYLKREKWRLTSEDLVKLAKVAFPNEIFESKRSLNGSWSWFYSKYAPATLIWGAEEFLRQEGQFHYVLNEETLANLAEHRPSSAGSLALASRLVNGHNDKAEEILSNWLEKLPSQDSIRARALLQLCDDVLVYQADPSPWVDQLEVEWLQAMSKVPTIWDYTDEVILRWHDWREKQGEESGRKFVARIMTNFIGPKEAWTTLPKLNGVRSIQLPYEISSRLIHGLMLMTKLAERKSGRMEIFHCLYFHCLSECYYPSQLTGLFSYSWTTRDHEELVDSFVVRLGEFARKTATIPEENLAQAARQLLSLMQAGQPGRLMFNEKSRRILDGNEWHPKLRNWIQFLISNDQKERFDLLDRLVEERKLFEQIMKSGDESFRSQMGQHFDSDWDELEKRIDESLMK